jgi:hypothetical protein
MDAPTALDLVMLIFNTRQNRTCAGSIGNVKRVILRKSTQFRNFNMPTDAVHTIRIFEFFTFVREYIQDLRDKHCRIGAVLINRLQRRAQLASSHPQISTGYSLNGIPLSKTVHAPLLCVRSRQGQIRQFVSGNIRP